MKLAKNLFFIIVFIVLVCGALFLTSGNTETVTVDYVFGKATAPLSVVLGYTFIIGFVLALIACLFMHWVNLLKLRSANAKIKSLEAQLKQARYDLEGKKLTK